MRYRFKFVLFLSLLILSASTSRAQFFSSESIQIQFAPTKVPDGVTWSPSVSLKDGGLSAEELPPNMAAEVWVQSQPISAGMSWRPPTSATVRLEVEAGAKDFTYLRAYFRYGCDRAHWSTWYNLRSQNPPDGISATVYESNLDIPRLAQVAYASKMHDWWQTNPPWSSDEHDLCVWITNQDPDFFSREFPFIGYIQVRIEGETRGLQLKSLAVKVNSAVSGLTTLSSGRTRSTTGEKWFFEVSKVKK
ncbi:MAG TPA: hypothetical protein VLB68_27730 [Pyrinomonadaceae bacterium]|nr:hypothetical protein [Pyrinomonadaceae bacterium]